jgi:hypothetical protein
MKVAIVMLSELTKDNPTTCLSALRAIGYCFRCPMYKSYKQRQRKLTCNPVIADEFIPSLAKEEALAKEIKDKMNELIQLRKERGDFIDEFYNRI